MQQFQARPPVGVIYDADFGNRINDPLALCLLYGLDGKNEARVISISISKPNLRAAGLAEVFGRFYSGAVSGAFGAIGRNLPIGMATQGADPGDTPMMTAVLGKKTPEGKPAYDHGINELNDTAEPAALIRNAFTSQYDQNCVVILNGPATNLAQMLSLPGVKDLITEKVRYLVIGGDLSANPQAARKLLAEWPGEVFAAGPDVAEEAPYPVASLQTDFTWVTTSHPLLDCFQSLNSPAPSASARDVAAPELAAVLFAIRQKEKYFGVSEPGVLELQADGKLGFKVQAQGKHRKLSFDAAQKERIQKAYAELVNAKPVPRTFGRRPQAAAAAKPDPAKPDPPKAEPPKADPAKKQR